MGKKADALLKVLAERDAEISRLESILDSGSFARVEFRILKDGRPVSVTPIKIITAGGGIVLEQADGKKYTLNSLDVCEINVPFLA